MTEPTKDFDIEGNDRFANNEAESAKNYWSGVDFEYYKTKQPWSDFIADRIAQLDPASVFEFGCNAGKNLAVISEKLPGTFISGIDINEAAIAWGREQGLNLAVADERALEVLPDNAFDVIYTVSVLDHLPDPETVFRSMIRVAKRGVFLLEPWLGEEGKVIRNRNLADNRMVDTTPFSYSWDYVRIGKVVAPDWHLDVEPFPMRSNLGRFYQLYRFTPVTQG
ncbi:class I SAM-dependent methyltransferase [Aurantiacibacter xanthus]|uniref:Class I SAM-dependent methyltransferase n=1 Tax=Aurantiacibacter xanthus TaxID=1784712 RepID=A0A3A1PAI4_9SPHN|nr:class I SAM-dependent methyltransferase [Aurantiacibacter xanthus]RIV89750.1 class I SAM-dependent methyltransferase [Aurantiacibacter xanthus]